MAILNKTIHVDRSFVTYNSLDGATTWQGAYNNCWRISKVLKLHGSKSQHLRTEWLESCRKDVECTFGSVKQRFRVLKKAVNYHSEKTIE
jgi:hypothetical protein